MGITSYRVGVFHPGTQHSWQSALAFQECGLLSWYATSVFYNPGKWPYKIERMLPFGIGDRMSREFRRRYTPLLDQNLVRTSGLDEWLETAARRARWWRLSHYFNVRGNRRFAQDVIRLIEREPVDVVWGYNSSSLGVFRWAKKRGLTCVLDQTIGHPRSLNRIMMEEESRHPEFFMDTAMPADEDWIRKEDEEMALADIVVVGSEFSRQTMIENGCVPEKLRVVPYGYDETLFPSQQPVRRPLAGRPIEFLFVGAVNPRKGVASLLKAFEQIDPSRARLTMVGSMGIPESVFRKYAPYVRHVPQVPRVEVVRYFGEADVFIFPSLFEGGGIVLYEAGASGLGIIQSKACGQMVSEDCPNGVVLSQVSVDEVRKAVEHVIGDPACIDEWSRVSWLKHSRWSWDVYRRRVRGIFDS